MIRPARPEDAPALHALTLASKGSWAHVLAPARRARWGATAMEWEADSNAAAFYERMGGRTVRTATSEWSRELDVMAVDLQHA